jgi:hypothetical protein
MKFLIWVFILASLEIHGHQTPAIAKCPDPLQLKITPDPFDITEIKEGFEYQFGVMFTYKFQATEFMKQLRELNVWAEVIDSSFFIYMVNVKINHAYQFQRMFELIELNKTTTFSSELGYMLISVTEKPLTTLRGRRLYQK